MTWERWEGPLRIAAATLIVALLGLMTFNQALDVIDYYRDLRRRPRPAPPAPTS
jgi:hypothetical protein